MLYAKPSDDVRTTDFSQGSRVHPTIIKDILYPNQAVPNSNTEQIGIETACDVYIAVVPKRMSSDVH